MNILRAAITAAIAAFLAALLLPMLGAFGERAAADVIAGNVTTLSFFEHDTQQTTVDLGTRGPGPGDQFIFSGDMFDHAGGTQVGHTAGLCTTLSGNDTTGETMCTQTFFLDGGQITGKPRATPLPLSRARPFRWRSWVALESIAPLAATPRFKWHRQVI